MSNETTGEFPTTWQAVSVFVTPAFIAAWATKNHDVPWLLAALLGLSVGTVMVAVIVLIER